MTIQVSLPSADIQTYSIHIGKNLLQKFAELINLKNYSQIAIITDANIEPFYLKALQEGIQRKNIVIILAPGEKNKTIKCVEKIWQTLSNQKFDRKSLIINLGGGVIGDMGGFAASTYMRGIDFINIPTTLLSQVDASIGGKTGIDFAGIKNLIGTFQQPKMAIIDVQTLKTLPDREFNAGFAEIIKHGLIRDQNYFQLVTSKKPREFSNDELTEIISRSCEIKKEIVQQDPEEKNIRKILNFGHTIGHAIESLSLETSEPFLHGEAISIGILAEAKISNLMNFISESDLETIKKAFVNAELPINITGFKNEEILEKIQSDKKNDSGNIRLTLLKNIGSAIYDEICTKELITQSIEYTRK